jgi:hypothetical protein
MLILYTNSLERHYHMHINCTQKFLVPESNGNVNRKRGGLKVTFKLIYLQNFY